MDRIIMTQSTLLYGYSTFSDWHYSSLECGIGYSQTEKKKHLRNIPRPYNKLCVNQMCTSLPRQIAKENVIFVNTLYKVYSEKVGMEGN